MLRLLHRGGGLSRAAELLKKSLGSEAAPRRAALSTGALAPLADTGERPALARPPESAALPAVDYALVSGGETTAAAGRVITAQANYMRVLVRWEDLTKSQRAARLSQLEAALRAAQDAGATEDVELLSAKLAYEARSTALHATSSDTKCQGPLELLCVVRALLKKMQRRVLVGDWVALSCVEWTAQRAMVAQPLPRSAHVLDDPPVANAQQLVLCFSLADPPVEAVQLTRFLVSAEAAGLPFRLVFNKADLGGPARRAEVAHQLAEWGYTGESAPHFVSVASGEGLEELAKHMCGLLTVIAGPSGVGKSSLINALRSTAGVLAGDVEADVAGAGGGNRGRAGGGGGGAGDWGALTMDTATTAEDGAWEAQSVRAVSDRSRRGRHTTRHVSLLRLRGGGLLADSPGFGLPPLLHVGSRELADCFPEVRGAHAAGSCAFADCSHREEPGCVVSPPALEWARYPLYRELFEELAAREAADARSPLRAAPGLRTKARRGAGVARTEVKLVPHKHRRTSRTNANASLQGQVRELERDDM